MKINKWFIPILIVAVNALAVIVKWSSLPELLPAHFDVGDQSYPPVFDYGNAYDRKDAGLHVG